MRQGFGRVLLHYWHKMVQIALEFPCQLAFLSALEQVCHLGCLDGTFECIREYSERMRTTTVSREISLLQQSLENDSKELVVY